MMMYEHEYKPENFIAGVAEITTLEATAGEAIKKFTPVVVAAGIMNAVTVDTAATANGIAVEDAEKDEKTCYYATGEFFASALNMPTDVTASDIKPYLEKLNIYLK